MARALPAGPLTCIFHGNCRNTASSRPLGWRCTSAAGVSSATMRPPAMTIAREHTASTSSRMCVEMTIALSGAMRSIRPRTSCFWFGSRPSVGSSSTSTGGSCSSAWARPTRRLNPFDSVSTGCSLTPRSVVRSSACSTRSVSSLPEKPAHLRAEAQEAHDRHLRVGRRALRQEAQHPPRRRRRRPARHGRGSARCRRSAS